MDQDLTLLLKAQDMATRTLKRVQSQISELNEAAIGLSKKGFRTMQDTWSKVSDSLKTGVAVGVMGVVGALGLAGKTAVDFQAEMNNLQAVSGATTAQMVELREAAKQMGIQTKFSAGEAAQAQTFLAMAGFSVEENLKSLPSVLELAAAGNLDLARSADIASNIMGQFAIQADDTARVTNVLAATASSSNTNIEQLSEAMKYLGPSAKALGMEIEETAAIIGVLGDSGIQGSLAGRALGSSLVRLAKPTEAMGIAMEQMNVQAFDAQGNFVGMSGLLKQLEKGTKGMSQQQKAANLNAMVGAEAFQELNILMERGSEAFDEYTKAITGTNKAQTMALIQQKGLPGALTAVNSAIQGQMIALFDLEFAGKSLIDWLGEATFMFVEFIRSVNLEEIKNQVINFARRGLEIASPAIEFLGGKAEVLKIFLASLAGVITAIVIPALVILTAKALLVAAPFVLMGLAVAGLYRLWVVNFAGIQEKTQVVFNYLVGVFNYFKDEVLPFTIIKMQEFAGYWTTTLQPAIARFLDVSWRVLLVSFNYFTNEIWPILRTILIGLADIFVSTLQPAVMSLWATFIKDLLPSLQSLWAFVSPVLIPTLKFLGVVFGVAIVGAVITVIGIFWALIKVTEALWKGISIAIDFIVGRFNEWMDKAKALKNLTQGVFEEMGGYISAPLKAALGPLGDLTSGLSNLIGMAKSAKDALTGVGGGGVGGLRNTKVPSFDVGTSHFAGGLAKVHKDEIVNLPAGSKVNTKSKSDRMTGGGGVTNNYINIKIETKPLENMKVSDQLDLVNKISRGLDQYFKQQKTA